MEHALAVRRTRVHRTRLGLPKAFQLPSSGRHPRVASTLEWMGPSKLKVLRLANALHPSPVGSAAESLSQLD